eukprot:gene12764-36414_t
MRRRAAAAAAGRARCGWMRAGTGATAEQHVPTTERLHGALHAPPRCAPNRRPVRGRRDRAAAPCAGAGSGGGAAAPLTPTAARVPWAGRRNDRTHEDGTPAPRTAQQAFKIRRFDPRVPLYLPIDDIVMDEDTTPEDKYEIYADRAPLYDPPPPDLPPPVPA